MVVYLGFLVGSLVILCAVTILWSLRCVLTVDIVDSLVGFVAMIWSIVVLWVGVC